MFRLISVPVLSDVVVIFFSSIVVLTPNGNFWVVPALNSVSDITNAGQDGSVRKLQMWLWQANFVTLHYSSEGTVMQNFLIEYQRVYVIRTVNYIRSKTLQQRQVKQFPEQVGSDYIGVFYHSAVRCWNRGAMLSWFFIFEITGILTRLKHTKQYHIYVESHGSRIYRGQNNLILNMSHGRLPCDMFSDVKKTFEVNLSLLRKLIDVKYLSKFTSYKFTVDCSNPKDDLHIPKCKSAGIIQNPQD